MRTQASQLPGDVAADLPVLLLTCGLPGTGKSFAARALASALGAVLLQSDVVRKALAGMAPAERCPPGAEQELYSRERTRQTYAGLHGEARRSLEAGCSVVVDATFPTASMRRPFLELAGSLERRFLLIHLRVGGEQVRNRMQARAFDSFEPSDADFEIHLAARERFEEPEEIPPARRLDLPGDLAPEEIVAAVRARLGATEKGP